MRTGFADVTLGLGMMRYLGLGYWTILDAGLILLEAITTF